MNDPAWAFFEKGTMVKTRFPAIIATGLAFAPPILAQTPALPDGNGKQIVETACAQCHKLTIVTNAGFSPENWTVVMRAMIHLGAKVPPDQVATVTDYLAKNFPKKANSAPLRDATPKAAATPANTDDGY
jgi:mono/diheme cytochrome c family protein